MPRARRRQRANPSRAEASINEVARLAGVSIATVSRCFNAPEKVTEKTRLKVQNAIRETGYAPNVMAQSLRRGRTNLIMVVLPSIGDPFFTNVMAGIRTAAKAKGYSVVIEETQGNTMTADEIGALMVSKQTDGLLLLASMSPFGTEILSAKTRRRLPIVVGCEIISPELTGFSSVHIDNIAAAREATNYLISRGHRRIAMITGSATSLLTKDRELGFRAAMKKAKIDIPPNWVVDGELTLHGAISATRTLLNDEVRPSAIFCATDEMAFGCMHATKLAGFRIPEDVSVMGFDDTRYAEVSDPPLTTIGQPAQEIGERSMYRLCREIENRSQGEAIQEIVPHRLIVRQSVDDPPGA